MISGLSCCFMGITELPLLDLIPKLRSWISSLSGEELAPMGYCYECRTALPGQAGGGGGGGGFRCRSCGRLFCRKCMAGGSRSEDGGGPRFCQFCFHAITSRSSSGGGHHLGVSDGSDSVPDSPMLRFNHIRLARLAESQGFASPRSLGCSTCRSDEEDDADNGGSNHFFSPSSELSQDVSDVDSVSISTGHELYSFKSVNSSPLDSPSRVGDSRDHSPGLLDHEASGYFRKPGAEGEDLVESTIDPGYDNLSVYHTCESNKAQPPLDFENNWRIWEPPPPEDENDDVETGFFDFEDEDDELGGSGMAFSSASFGSDAFGSREKPSGVHKEHLNDTVRVHFRALVSQLLKGEGISIASENGGEGWLEIVSSLAWQAATFVKPDTSRGGSMDPGDYVKVKCIFSGRPSDSILVKGVVCTKNVKHKRMVSQHKSPRLFLLGGSLEYQKVPNELASINTVLKQEIDHLKMSVAKIEAHRPNVLLVEKSVSSYAQQYLLTKEISLVLNVKRKLLERISRCTGAQIAPSIDNIASARLGQCEMFKVEKVFEQCSTSTQPNKKSIKTLMFFEGCPKRLGCTVLLRGTHSEELKKLKHVLQYASFAAYHLSRETSFIADEGATLPKVPSNPLMSMPATMMNAETCMPKTLASRHQTIPSDNEELLDSEHEECISSFNQFNSGNISCSPPIEYKLHGDFAPESTLVLSLCGSASSRSGFGCQENCAPSHAPADVRTPRGVDNKYEEKGKSANQSGESNGQTDIDDGSEVLPKYLLTADNHQSILVSLSSTCILKGTVCEPPRIFRIKFYGSCDKPIGTYLRNDLFDQTSFCRYCNEPAEAHVQCYTHKHGSLTVNVRQLPSMKLSGERDGRIWMWHRCLKCEPKNGVPPAVRRVVMSDAACALSFGKFLDLSFSNHATANRVASCGHSLQKDCLRFYGCGSMVAFFRYSPADILSVQLPPLVLDFTCQIHQDWVRGEAAAISNKMEFLHSEVFDVLHGIEQKVTMSDYEPVKESIHKCIVELKNLLEKERSSYDVLLQSAAAENSTAAQAAAAIFQLNRLRRCLLIDSYTWDRRLCLLDSFSKSKSSTSKLCLQAADVEAHTNMKEWRDETVCRDAGLGNSSEEKIKKFPTMTKQHEEVIVQVLECNSSNLVEMDLPIESVEGYVGSAGLNIISGQCYRGDEKKISGDACVEDESCTLENATRHASSLSDKIDSAWIGNPEADSVGTFSLMDNPFYRKMMSPVRVNSFDSALRVRDRMRGGLSPASFHLSSVKSFDASGVSSPVKDPLPSSPLALSQRSSRPIKRLNFNQSHSTMFISSSSYMVSEGARLLLPQTGLEDVVIVLYDNEPTTIISHAISSQEHSEFIASKLDQHEGLSENEKLYGTGRLPISQFQSDEEPQSLRGNPSVDSRSPHFRISFDDESSIPADRVKFSVTCYFANQFNELRKRCCPNEVDFLRSLNRCKRWNAQGGKSNVYFAKSFDERFIIKQVTRTELDSFEEFAHSYFNYLMESINSGSPTCLAKVFGIYQVTVKHLKGGREVKMDLMVMENLFFGRNISRVYDLKGSSRARYNPATSGNNNVLLDLNLLEALRTKPIFLASKAKRSLERAVWNDTAFLASIDVMDYSLLVGVDEERKELVIGIIDFMRQYTWDKHLETWVKASGILGGPKNSSPTVISPGQYKKRFRKAMSNYFRTVPDQWPS